MKREVTPAAVLLVVGLAGACGGTQAERSTPSPGLDPADLVARRGELVQRHLITGELKAVRSETVRVPRGRTWQTQIRWLADDGARVSEGDRVVELDNSALVGELDQAVTEEITAYNNLAQKEGELAVQEEEKIFQLEQKRVELEKARIEAAVPAEIQGERDYRDKQLALRRAVTAFENARAELEGFRTTAEVELEILRIALDTARRELQAVERAIDQLVLRAPRDGIFVVEQNRDEGRRYQVGDNVFAGHVAGRIPDLTEMEVEAFLDDVDDGRIAVGDRATCSLDAWPGLSWGCQVAEISPIAGEASFRSLRRRFRVRLTLDSTDSERMRPGMSTKVDVVPATAADMVLAPRAALDLSVEPPRAYLRDGASVEIALGPCNALECVVERGLEPGARLGAAP